MIARLFALILILLVVGVGTIFLFPDFADRIGNPTLNASIRKLKHQTENIGALSGSSNPKSLIENLSNNAVEMTNEVRSTATQVKSTIDTKTQEVKQAADSVQNAYQAVEKAKNDIQKVSIFQTGSVKVNSGVSQ